MSTGTGPCDLPRMHNTGKRDRRLSTDIEGFRTYKEVYRVEVDPSLHGPFAARFATPGLPDVGSGYDDGEFLDPFVYYTNECEVRPAAREGHLHFYDVELTATNRPTKDCVTAGREDPLTYPDRVEIRTINYNKEATHDRFDVPITNSAFEQYRGPVVEFDAHRLQIIIEQNVSNIELDTINELMHTLNDEPLWGFPDRTVKLSNVEVSPRYHVDCEKYYHRRLTFDVANDFDRCVLDEGTKVLRGKWDKNPNSPTYGQYVIAEDEDGPFGLVDPTNPKNYIRFQDWNGNEARVVLNGHGLPVDTSDATSGTADDTPGRICIEYYPNGNFALLDLPGDLENP